MNNELRMVNGGKGRRLGREERQVRQVCQRKCEFFFGTPFPYQRVNEIVNGRRGITPATALRLAKYFGTSAAFWLNLQLRWDLFFAQKAEAESLDRIEPVQL